MAQTAYSKVQIYSSSTATNTPSAGNLTNDTNGSELAINITDGKLFYKDNGGTVQVIASKSANAGTFSSVSITGGSITGVSLGTVTNNTTFSSTGAITLPAGTTAQEPTGVQGMLRFNTTTSQFEGYNGTSWASVGGAAISNDTSTASVRYPLFASSTSGTALTVYTSNANYLYTPSTGQLQAPEVLASNGLLMMSTTIANSATVPTGSNAIMVGPYNVASGASLTISTGQRMVVL